MINKVSMYQQHTELNSLFPLQALFCTPVNQKCLLHPVELICSKLAVHKLCDSPQIMKAGERLNKKLCTSIIVI